MNEADLLDRLYDLLEQEHARYGQQVERLSITQIDPDFEIHRVGKTGVIAFINDYALTAWPDDEQRAAAVDAYRILGERLDERGFTLHMVFPLNFRSVRLTRKLGAKPIGTDDDGYVHYRLESKNFSPRFRENRHG